MFLILTTDQITMCNVRGVTHSDDNYHLTMQFITALWSILVNFVSLLWFFRPTSYSYQPRFLSQKGSEYWTDI